MYDNVVCHATLPDGYVMQPGDDFQTKDGECCLGRYVITTDGRLTFALDRPYIVAEGVSYSGSFHFYGHGDGGWHEYVAEFEDGRLQSIAFVEDPRR